MSMVGKLVSVANFCIEQTRMNEKHFLKVHNPHVIILLICINDVQCVIYEGCRSSLLS